MESGDDKFPCKSPTGWGSRHTLVFLGFWSYVFNFAMRFNLSIAIVAMVHHDPRVPTILDNDLAFNGTTSTVKYGRDGGGIPSNQTTNTSDTVSGIAVLDEEEEFIWSLVEQGCILGSFFWGYLVMGIPGGLLAQKYGGKWVISIGLLIAAILTFLIPLSARAGLVWIISVRALQGMAEGVTTPAMQTLLSNWIPPNERGRMSTAVHTGVPVGTALTMVVSGYLIEYFGWPSVFYGIGGATFIWFILWTLLVFSSPEAHPRIEKEEADYIKCSIGDQVSRDKTAIPWGSILTSVPVLAAFGTHMAHSWGAYTLLSELPTYMKTALNFEMKQNKWASASPHICTWIFATLITYVGDLLIERKILSTTLTRKLCNTVAQWGSASCLVVVAYSECDPVVTLVFLNLTLGLLGGAMGGFMVNPIDISPNHAGVIMGIDHVFSNLCAFAGPYTAGQLLSGDPSPENWRSVFLISAGVFFMGNLVYLTFGSSQEAPWNRETTILTETSKASSSCDMLNLRITKIASR